MPKTPKEILKKNVTAKPMAKKGNASSKTSEPMNSQDMTATKAKKAAPAKITAKKKK